MDKGYLTDILIALRAELIRFRFWCVLLFLGTSFMVLGLGLLWPKHYTTSAILFADETNILEPLLKGTAEVTKIDRSEQASEVIYTKRIMLAAAKKSGLINENMSEQDQAKTVRQLQNNVSVKKERNNNHFTVSYTSKIPDQSFEVLNAIINVFIADTARKKRDESVGAFNFIDSQVQIYKKQLEAAEGKLKIFNSANTDGTEESVGTRIASLREEIETLKISNDEVQARIDTIRQQIGSEGQYLQSKGVADELKARRQLLTEQLQQLLFTYEEGYPDIISIRSQIAELDKSINKLQVSGGNYGNSGKVENPLFEELRKQLSEAELEQRTQKRRVESLKSLQVSEVERQKRIAENQAQLSELTRDYDVTRKVYEEMLQRKEAARLSMTLDIEGQGVTYRIQEPASFPLTPSGLHFLHFAMLGPILGLLLPIALLIMYVVLDPHLRSAKILQQQLPPDIELIGVIPHFNSPIGERLLRKDTLFILAVSVAAMLCYLGVSIFWQLTHS
jgi:polysaccharide chain length determinant protein (PEP-CTERM system associated)